MHDLTMDRSDIDDDWSEEDDSDSQANGQGTAQVKAVRGRDFTARVTGQSLYTYTLEAPALPLSTKVTLHRGQAVGTAEDQEETPQLSLGQEVVIKIVSFSHKQQVWAGSMKAVLIDQAIKAALPASQIFPATIAQLDGKQIIVNFADRFWGYIPTHLSILIRRQGTLTIGDTLPVRVVGWHRHVAGPVVHPINLTVEAEVVRLVRRLTKKGRCLRIAAELTSTRFGQISVDVSHLYNAFQRLPAGRKVRVTIQPSRVSREPGYSGILEPFDAEWDAMAEAQNRPVLCLAKNRLDYGMFCLVGDRRDGMLHFASQPEGAVKEAALRAKPGDWLRVIPAPSTTSNKLNLTLVIEPEA